MENQQTRVHDYLSCYWGHSIVVHGEDAGVLKTSGWGRGIRAGDTILVRRDLQPTSYRVDRISYYADPPDMWRADLVLLDGQASTGVLK